MEEEDLFAALMAGVAGMKVKFCGGKKSLVWNLIIFLFFAKVEDEKQNELEAKEARERAREEMEVWMRKREMWNMMWKQNVKERDLKEMWKRCEIWCETRGSKMWKRCELRFDTKMWKRCEKICENMIWREMCCDV